MADLLQVTDRGLYCADGDFYVDPWKRVDRAVITHAHSDHARPGMGSYLCAEDCKRVLHLRIGQKASIETLAYGEAVEWNGVRVSLHPAGHILGSSQVRIERRGEVVVVSGDYKTEPDRTCRAFEPIRCHTFITESTFGLPIYRWPKESVVFGEINRWWEKNQTEGKATFLLGYSLGKSQRVLSGLDPSIGPIVAHSALIPYIEAYRDEGVELPAVIPLESVGPGFDWSKAAVLVPPNLSGANWTNGIGPFATAYMSGWMAVRGTWRSRAVDKGFVMSDHVDWDSLIQAVTDTGAHRVLVTHGFSETVAQFLRELGLDAQELKAGWRSDSDGFSDGDED